MSWRRTLVTVNAVLALVSFGLGSTLTSAQLRAELGSGYTGLSGSRLLEAGHRHLSYLLLAMLLLVVAAVWRSGNRPQRVLAVTAAASAVAAALVSSGLVSAGYRVTLHAFFGELVTGCSVALAALFSRRATAAHPPHRLAGGLPLRTLALWLLPLVLSQVAMGALYRHGLWSILPHMAGALMVSAILVAVSVTLLQQAADHPALAAAARVALGVVLLQVVLGIADFLLRLLDFQDTDAWVPLSVAHVLNASLLLAASLGETAAVLAFVRQD